MAPCVRNLPFPALWLVQGLYSPHLLALHGRGCTGVWRQMYTCVACKQDGPRDTCHHIQTVASVQGPWYLHLEALDEAEMWPRFPVVVSDELRKGLHSKDGDSALRGQ